MQIEHLLVFLIVGAIVGFLAGSVIKGYGFGLVGNIAIGILGAVAAGWLFPNLGLNFGSAIQAQIISATIGAIGLLVMLRFVRWPV